MTQVTPNGSPNFWLNLDVSKKNGGFPQQPWSFPTKNDHFGV